MGYMEREKSVMWRKFYANVEKAVETFQISPHDRCGELDSSKLCETQIEGI